MTAEQKAQVKEILSKYNASSLTAKDAKAINDAFRSGGTKMGLPCKMPSGTLVSLRREWGSWTRLRINQGRAGRLPISQAGAVRAKRVTLISRPP